ncbi:MAG: NADH-quinone oxidoreductase subunit NuoE [Pelagibacteraceae bacterium]|jgi:NADH-quinone oxidoreductase subunit E|nr:NADH-quinone oxidoreductase subunit NuoE [Pelagibacteraceae bacterium]HJL58311.1 NADH-quinone oxidoreductase subunit NuoE [Alphaproteobacteria bacterium]MBO6466244.1 NADH-quinone oxidoreductase subunit NuoE [Pelagibacteraceae bacterium]MBO6467930.1 NADH-quinone oxidoreductase subunit NuoE [Pelagibacteraceae bacterium]MBO6468784.1 NADH-quinone oxidoreductase subunit NuoE [Pelagibacteraceae bacterium]|tara:strand:- start:233 stop:823 length:591 start_codon:yes stop_codon:yes gene_type:complete
MKHPGMINIVSDTSNEIFEWSERNFSKVKIVIEKYPAGKQQSAVIPILDLAQRQNNGWLNRSAIEKVSETLSMSFIRVMEVVSFYSMFNLEPVGKNFIQICRTTPCWLRGSNKLLDVVKEVTGCNLGETSEDKKFTLVEVECLGACCNSPMVQINDDYYEDLNEDNFRKVLLKLKNNENINKGSQSGRRGSSPEKN